MAPDATEYLAINVLNEEQLVSYRMLSRALKVHSNLAKCMLEDFHRKQNAKKSGSVHATYLLTGTRRNEQSTQSNGMHNRDKDGDTVMQSSPPFPSSSAAKSEEAEVEPVPLKSVVLVKEEHLEQAKATFEDITSLHVYSLEAHGLGDLQLLTECNRKIAASYASEDPLQATRQYGVIQNPKVKRRTLGRKSLQPPADRLNAIGPAERAVLTAPRMLKTSDEGLLQDSNLLSQSSSANVPPDAPMKPKTAKKQSSDIFKSFAKSKTKLKNNEPQQSVDGSPAREVEDEPMMDFSEEEADDVTDDEATEKLSVPTGKSKKEREAELKAMMDKEDEVAEGSAQSMPNKAAQEDEEDITVDRLPVEMIEEPQETVVVENGRRRGRRRVMKKKTVKDEDGYLVTKEEAVWESFSEDDPVPKKAKLPSASSTNKPGAKKMAKAGQGNIMSFFSKK
ncbi:hypothetical protein M433DRAFT_88910 [Acidomyces richmondensis BFW]|nr:MAG: hypothetical protein FE78DRAFT_27718 [Acidomyces sp. 'richmondensis']KYG45753.1 hypothetical protein M433DRAFT_88910 [Acidomyces richmondensis BFW]